ncbi:hypothetical protein DPMN_063680 [Dreissena polymorpha]|uniref:Uncharacterized protein n=1 Tax=Dreissena polymorpha TaxID=45954 RepID=A0A9D4CAZ1_DREPO|nr:hypothetical protein DPMN_063680 [Dreissena polymorpha]
MTDSKILGIAPLLRLFQRFVVVSKSGDLSLEDILLYELNPQPPALLDARNVLRKAYKPQISQSMKDQAVKQIATCLIVALCFTKNEIAENEGIFLVNGDECPCVARGCRR